LAILKPCIEQVDGRMCGRLVESPWNRCAEHRKGHDRPRYAGSATARGYDRQHRNLRKRVLVEHVARHGLMCLGYLVAPHPVNHESELQLDHVVPLADGGAADYSNAQILCGRCNRRKGAASPIAPTGPRTVNEPAQPPQPKPTAGPFFR